MNTHYPRIPTDRIRSPYGRSSRLFINGTTWNVRIGKNGVRLYCPHLSEDRIYPISLVQALTSTGNSTLRREHIVHFISTYYTEIINDLPIY